MLICADAIDQIAPDPVSFIICRQVMVIERMFNPVFLFGDTRIGILGKEIRVDQI
jgi:hypothetical protein